METSFPLAQASPPEAGLLERLRQTATFRVPAFRKLFEEAQMPVQGTAVDLLPFVIMFILMAAGVFLTLKLKHRQTARRAIQICSALAFIVGVHPCMCMIRDVTFGMLTVSTNSLEAFRYLMVFSVVGAFGLVFGRIFCGWICPLGFFQELSSAYFSWARRHPGGGILTLALISVVTAASVAGGFLGFGAVAPFVGPVFVLLLVYVLVPHKDKAFIWAKWALVVALLAYVASYFFLLHPATFGFIETVAVWWVLALLVFALFVVGDPALDRKLKLLKFLSLGLIVMIIATGVYANGPFCVFFQSVVDLSTVLSAMGIIVLSGVLSSAWCRYLCPEGALLGLMARHSRWKIAKVDARCNACRACEPVCPVGAMELGERDETTCVFCSKCVEACPTTALIVEDVGLSTRLGRPPGFVPLDSLLRRG